jgi:Cdc6-like AAA superfamily ATPase
MPIYTQCLRPDDYEDIRLFVPRSEEEQVCSFLTSFLDNPQLRWRRLLVTGERGIGKSIGVRAAVARLEEERRDFFPLIINGHRCTTIRHLVVTIAEEFSRRVRDLFPDDKDLIKQASHLPDMLQPDQMTRGEFYRRGRDIEVATEIDYGLLAFIKARLGIRGALSSERGTEETASIRLDDSFRIQLLAEVLRSVARQKKRQPLLFVDNLDQITEKERIEEFLRYLLWLEELPVVITIRSEFVSADIHRTHREILRFGPLSQKQLLAIFERRLEVGCPEAEALRHAGLPAIARGLSKITGNPWAFLHWLHYLCWYTNLRPRAYLKDLCGYVCAYYGTDYQPEAPQVWQAARWFFAEERGVVPRAMWKEGAGLDDNDLDALEQQGVLVPDDITRPRETRRYAFSPLLKFLKFVEE